MKLGRRDIDAILFDFDGVLTDNRVWVFQDGREAVACSRADGLAFDWFRAASLPVWIVSTERNEVVTRRAQKLKVPALQAVTDKAVALRTLAEEQNFALDRLIFVGNDVNDLPAMRLVGYPIAVADAHQAVLDIAAYRLATRGGQGVAREIAETILNMRPYDDG
jgi:YrbI family 3-deoxy-D-manno-octulosonate 8-phosphate phosphatase